MMAWPNYVPIVVPIIIGTGLIPRMEELESLILYGKPASANKRAPRKATPLMKLMAWLAMAANASWVWQLYHRETPTDFAILIVQGLVGADICSGIYHWFQDSFRSTSEAINAALFDNFQIHHECARQRHGSAPLYPSPLPIAPSALYPTPRAGPPKWCYACAVPYLIVKHDWEYVSWELFAGAFVGHMLGWLYADVGDYPVFRCTMTFVACINHVHRLAHMRNPFPGGFDLPWPFQGRKHHAMHHKVCAHAANASTTPRMPLSLLAV